MLDVEVDLVGDLRALTGLGGLRKEQSAETQQQQCADEKPAHVKHGRRSLLIE